MTARIFRPRTFRTFYFTSLRDPEHKWARVGRACTRESAVRAAIVKVLLGQYEKVCIVNEDGINVAILEQRGKTTKIVCV
jgi:hypothetical protein